MEQSITERLLSEYDTFTTAEKKIADYVLANQRVCASIGITDLAAECGVAVSTVSVFCRKLRLNGFNDFKLELARDGTLQAQKSSLREDVRIRPGDGAEQIITKSRLRGQEILRSSSALLDPRAVDQAVELMLKARHVLMLGQGNHSALALVTWTQFSMISPKFQTISDSHLQTIALANLSPGDVVLYFSNTGATLEIMDAVEVIRQVGARLILVTRFSQSPAAEFSDVVLISGADGGPVQFDSFDALFSQIYVVDVLLGCYCQRCSDPVEEKRAFIDRELWKKHL